MDLFLVAAGMVTAVGYNAHSTSAAVSSVISGIGEVPFNDNNGESLLGAKVDLPQWWEGYAKLVDLVAPAIYECLATIPTQLQRTIPLLIGVPLKEYQFYPDEDNAKLLAEIERKLELPHHPASKLFPYGQVAGAKALKQAYKLLTENQDYSYCVVAGVDSYLEHDKIRHYMNEYRLLTEENSNGFIPGEASGAVLVSLQPQTNNKSLTIIGMGEGTEPAPINSEEIFKAKGMTDAIRAAIQDAGINLVDASIHLTDLNGEHYKFEEITLATDRFNTIQSEKGVDLDIWHPGEFWGEIGAATIPCLLSYAWVLAQKDRLKKQMLLVTASNDKEDRVAILIKH